MNGLNNRQAHLCTSIQPCSRHTIKAANT